MLTSSSSVIAMKLPVSEIPTSSKISFSKPSPLITVADFRFDAKNSDLKIRFTSDYHSANFVPVWATGPGSEVFDAFMDNTEIGKQLIKYVKSR